MRKDPDHITRRGRRMGLAISGIGVLWVLANIVGSDMGWSNRTRALFDLIALAGFGLAFVYAIWLWRARNNDEDKG
ncbi:MAG: DUF5337 domain-containing protein [Pseudomonadota bacterium]